MYLICGPHQLGWLHFGLAVQNRLNSCLQPLKKSISIKTRRMYNYLVEKQNYTQSQLNIASKVFCLSQTTQPWSNFNFYQVQCNLTKAHVQERQEFGTISSTNNLVVNRDGSSLKPFISSVHNQLKPIFLSSLSLGALSLYFLFVIILASYLFNGSINQVWP